MSYPETPQRRTAVTLSDIKDKVKKTTYTVLPDGKTTICQLHMENGYTINGHSACVDPANYNQALGEQYSFEDAIKQAWPLEGYLLSEEIFKRGPVIKFYSMGDMSTCAMQDDLMLGGTRFVVAMRDGCSFEGFISPNFNGGRVTAMEIIANVNRQILEGAEE